MKSINLSLFSHVAMIALSIGIGFTVIEPLFNDIGEMQDTISVYQTELQSVSQVNSQLSSMTSVLNSVAPDDQRRLLTYMPDEVDTVGVLRDLSIISNEAGVVYLSIVSSGQSSDDDSAEESASGLIQPNKYLFNLRVEGTYGQIKNLFTLFEQNNYPIEMQDALVQQKEGGLLAVDMNLSVYAYEDSAAEEVIVF